jgi:hypothetical protein
MKNGITKLESVLASIKDMKEVWQELWNEVNSKEWRYLTKRLSTLLSQKKWLLYTSKIILF